MRRHYGFIALAFVISCIMLIPSMNAIDTGGAPSDKSMITVEGGSDEFFLDKDDAPFVWDMIFKDERVLEVTLNIINPNTGMDHHIDVWLSSQGSDGFSFKIVKFIDPSGKDIERNDIENVAGRLRMKDVPAGGRFSVLLEARYTGKDADTEFALTVHSQLVGNGFTTSRTLTFRTYEGSQLWLWIALVSAVIGLGAAFVIANGITKKEVADEKLKEISGFIRDGAMAFLNAEYKVIAIYIVSVIVLLLVLFAVLGMSWLLIPAFIIGAFFSAMAGNIGMRIATMANAKTAWECKKSMNAGLRVAFSSGAVMGLCVVGLGLLGVTLLYSIWGNVDMLFGFGFGASSIALFARVGGGIYTKAADVGADLVGKVEAGIPEDDPRNPATIADNVGDNVGDVAGMGADLFESYVDSIIAAMALGIAGITLLGDTPAFGGASGLAVILPILLAGIGIISAIIGTFFVNAKEGQNPHSALNKGIYGASVFMGVLSLVVMFIIFKGDLMVIGPLFGSMLVGLGAGILIGKATEYYTSADNKPTRTVSEASTKGAATNIIAGLGLGMLSTVIPVLAVCFTIVVAFLLSGLYGIALAAVGMLSTLGITLATDSYGPVADNAAGLAEMADLGKTVRKRAEDLDAVGNTTAAIGKGFAIGSAGLTALALFSTYTLQANMDLSKFTLINPYVVVGVFIGGLLPFVFSALSMMAVGAAAQDMVEEVRRQFKEIKGIMTGKARPDYQKCVEISTKGAIRKMILPSLIAVLTPLIVGMISIEALGGLLAGSIVTGFVLAVMMANSGGAWDNAKKYIEAGNFGGKGSDPHKAAVVGDTVGDPFKDTSGPSLNILIKLMSIVALVFIPLFLFIQALW